MQTVTPLSQVNDTFKEITDYVKNKKIGPASFNEQSTYIVFLSVGNPNIRARVIKEVSPNLSRALERLHQKTQNLVRKNHIDPQWIKVDIVTEVKELPYEKRSEERRVGKR